MAFDFFDHVVESVITVAVDLAEDVERKQVDAEFRGYTETMLKRRRYLRELEAPSDELRSKDLRVAVNTPIQGTAADVVLEVGNEIIKMEDKWPGVEVLLEVHDEWLFRIPINENVVQVISDIKSDYSNIFCLCFKKKPRPSINPI